MLKRTPEAIFDSIMSEVNLTENRVSTGNPTVARNRRRPYERGIVISFHFPTTSQHKAEKIVEDTSSQRRSRCHTVRSAWRDYATTFAR